MAEGEAVSVLASSLCAVPPRTISQVAESRGTASAPVHPEYHWPLDASLYVAGTALLLGSNPLDVTTKPVPPEGLNRSAIHWSVDREIIGERSRKADKDSDLFRDGAVAYPMLLALISQPSGARVGGMLRRSVIYVESIMVCEGISSMVKNLADRPRPYTYLAEADRPKDSAYNVTSDEAFRSMPSGHSTISFCAAGFAMADHLITRPDARWEEHVAVGLVGGMLAGMTAGMRLEGGQHFPSDTIIGGAIGIASGVTVPLVHHYIDAEGRRAPRASTRAWLQAAAGTAVGACIGIWASEAAY
jgi:hypothetical protein